MSNPPNDTIFQYVRNRRRQKVGAVVALRLPQNKVGIGWSLCSGNLGDKFDNVRALEIAVGRALNAGGLDPVPASVHEDYNIIVDRANRYFKGAEVLY